MHCLFSLLAINDASIGLGLITDQNRVSDLNTDSSVGQTSGLHLNYHPLEST